MDDKNKDLDKIEYCTYCNNPIYINRESHIKDIGTTIFHSNCYGKYISIMYNKYQEVI